MDSGAVQVTEASRGTLKPADGSGEALLSRRRFLVVAGCRLPGCRDLPLDPIRLLIVGLCGLGVFGRALIVLCRELTFRAGAWRQIGGASGVGVGLLAVARGLAAKSFPLKFPGLGLPLQQREDDDEKD